MSLRLGVLDYCFVSETRSAHEALWDSVALAKRLEQLGYTRYWATEHHVATAAHTSPQLLAAVIASNTSRIRVGTGGVLLRYYSAQRIAEDCAMLSAMFPDRFELGIVWGPGVEDDAAARALVSGNAAELTYPKFVHKAHLLRGLLGASHPLWVLGSGNGSLDLAIACNANYGFTLTLAPTASYGPGLLELHRTKTARRRCIGFSLWCSDFAKSPVPPARFTVAGNRASCAKQVRELAVLYNVDDLLISTDERDLDARIRTYEWLAETFLVDSDAGHRAAER